MLHWAAYLHVSAQGQVLHSLLPQNKVLSVWTVFPRNMYLVATMKEQRLLAKGRFKTDIFIAAALLE